MCPGLTIEEFPAESETELFRHMDFSAGVFHRITCDFKCLCYFLDRKCHADMLVLEYSSTLAQNITHMQANVPYMKPWNIWDE